jgi:hypothetical protein
LTSNADGTVYTTWQTSAFACPVFTANAFFQYVNTYWYIFGPVMMAVGLFFCFLGFKMFQLALFLVAFIVCAGFCLFIFYSTFLSTATAPWLSWTMFGLCCLLGVLGGFLSIKLQSLAGAVLAAWGGFLLGVLFNETCLYTVGSEALFWSINIIFALICFVLGWKFTKHAEVIATSFIGSFMTMKGIGIMAGGFPNIYALIHMIDAGAWDSIPASFYGYLAGIIVLFIISCVAQFKFFFHKEQVNTHPYAMLN